MKNDFKQIVDTAIAAHARQLAKDILSVNALATAISKARASAAPLTRWERVANRLRDYRERITTAWSVLRGEDIHRDCY